jgi:hypothetical protein
VVWAVSRFVGRADMIIVLFDAHKLDISDELKSVLDLLKPHQDKVSGVLGVVCMCSNLIFWVCLWVCKKKKKDGREGAWGCHI